METYLETSYTTFSWNWEKIFYGNDEGSEDKNIIAQEIFSGSYLQM